VSAPPIAGPEINDQPAVVHSIPGRVRLRFDKRDSRQAATLVQRLSAHPAVWSVRWSPSARSLTIQYLPTMTLRELLLTAPSGTRVHAEERSDRRLDWGRVVAACLMASLPLGVLASVALALVTEVATQTAGRLDERRWG
jgi:hypothetical protein